MLQTAKMLNGETRLDYLKRVIRWCRTEYKRIEPFEYGHVSHIAAKAMKTTEVRYCDMGTFGVEGFGKYLYLNTGEAYEITILFNCDKQTFFIGSWGDIAELNLE